MYLGIEIGGTKLQLGLGPGDGTLAALWRARVDPAAGADGVREQIVAGLPELFTSANVVSVRAAGIGFGGPVNDATRRVITSHQVAGWDDFPLAEWLEGQLGVPAALGNDADTAGLAEAHFGAGRGLDPVFYVTIGSGIGGGLIVGGHVYRGTGLGAAEIGHLRLRTPDGYSILEHLASGWAIERRAGVPVAELAERYRVGDAAAQAILNESWAYLAEAVCQVVALVCPARVVIGGGVSLVGEDVLFAPLRRMVAERVFRPFAGCFDIVPAALGEEVVVHGALALARQTVSAT
jgi:glucokinase